jgi:DNA-binding response OmpR family regulator
MDTPRTVLVIEDDDAILDALSYQLERSGHRVLRARDGTAGLRLFTRERPDLLVVDLMLPQIDGWQITRQVREKDPTVPIIVVSARTSEHDRVNGLELGADDYVTKPFSMKELVARVSAQLRRVERSRRPDGRGRIEAIGLVLDPDQVQAFFQGNSADLTPREFQVLYALAEQEGKPIPRERLYREVWGYAMTRGDRSVDVFVKKVRQKLRAVAPEASFVRTHHGVGYTFEPETETADSAGQ